MNADTRLIWQLRRDVFQAQHLVRWSFAAGFVVGGVLAAAVAAVLA